MGRTILMVAAEAREFDGLRKHVESRPLEWGLQFACEADLHGDRAILVADGPGMQCAGRAADVARRNVRPEVVVSTGYCGAVDPVAGQGRCAGGVHRRGSGEWKNVSGRIAGNRTVRPVRGEVLSMNHVAGSASEKRTLRGTGARVVEMEAAAVAARALTWNVPFYCVRSVSDTAAESFEIDFNLMRDAQGRFSRGRIALAALGRPWSRIPALVSLDRSCRQASKSLGDFLANCRF